MYTGPDNQFTHADNRKTSEVSLMLNDVLVTRVDHPAKRLGPHNRPETFWYGQA